MSREQPTYVEIGHTRKTRGVEGEVKVFVKKEYMEDFLAAKVVFLDVQGGYVPFFVERIRESNTLLLKLEDIDSPEEAVVVAGKPLFIRTEDLQPAKATTEATDYAFLEGFRIVDREKGAVGPILEILEYPQQIIAIVEYAGREILIPLNDQLIVHVDPRQGILEMELPEGLLEL